MAVVAYAPASIGNVSVGFDVLGAALAPIDGSLLGDRVEHRVHAREVFMRHGVGQVADAPGRDEAVAFRAQDR